MRVKIIIKLKNIKKRVALKAIKKERDTIYKLEAGWDYLIINGDKSFMIEVRIRKNKKYIYFSN